MKRRIFQPTLRFLPLGLWSGVLDGYGVLRMAKETAGTWSERLATLLASCLADGIMVTAMAFVLAGPALILGRRSRFSFTAWHVALVLAFLPALVVLGAIRGHPEYGFTSGRYIQGAGILVALSLGGATALVRVTSRLVRPEAYSPRIGRVAMLALIPAALILTSIGWRNEARGATSRGGEQVSPNVLLISLDTLRADHLGLYGYERDTSPHLDALAREALVFDRAYSHANWTLSSHASMLTGLDPTSHGATDHEARLDEAFETLAEALAERGYRTAAFVGAAADSFVGSRHNLDQGFEIYEHYPYPPVALRGLLLRAFHHVDFKLRRRSVGDTEHQVDTVQRWLRHSRQAPFFLFFHSFDIHLKPHCLPYEAPPPFFDRFCEETDPAWSVCRPQYGNDANLLSRVVRGLEAVDSDRLAKIVCLYDGGIAYVDHQIGRLLETLRELDLWDQTIVVVTSDHGEAFFDHQVALHTTIHQEILQVPLIIKPAYGAHAGRRIEETVGLTRLYPTILELASPDDTHRPQSLVPLLAGTERAGTVDPETIHYAVGSPESLALIRGRWKYILTPIPATGDGQGEEKHELYDLAQDPRERHNVATLHPELLHSLREELLEDQSRGQLFFEGLVGPHGSDSLEMTKTQRDRLRALGYLD